MKCKRFRSELIVFTRRTLLARILALSGGDRHKGSLDVTSMLQDVDAKD
jgi:hypothetical protein